MIHASFRVQTPWLRKLLHAASIALGTVLLLVLVILVFFFDTLLNGYGKDRMLLAFAEAYPSASLQLGDMSYHFWSNRLDIDSIRLVTADSGMTCSVSTLSLHGIAWMRILWPRDTVSLPFENAVLDARGMAVRFRPSMNSLRIDALHLSAPDSVMTLDSVHFLPGYDDEDLFALSRYRQTRFRFSVPLLRISALDCAALLRGDGYRARHVAIENLAADILVNMDKPYDAKSTPPQMPNEAFAAIRDSVRIDSVTVSGGSLNYCERIAVRGAPGVITFDRIAVKTGRISNTAAVPDTTIIHAEGRFMGSANMTMEMALPLSSTTFSLRYSGYLGHMQLTALNDFLVPCEHRRVTEGVMHAARYSVHVVSGKSRGTLRAEYTRLRISVLDAHTGSSKGIFNRIASFIGKVFVIRGSNMPGERGSLKLGTIRRTRKADDYFLQNLWFALRGGVADVVGFTEK
ncbi:MAG: hypothetical protein IPP94_03570 [Ignavibacteria bacterium]|nr:hypothetical protein [Ignavibacteria bacterium]